MYGVPLPTSFFRVPYEVVKQRLQVGQYPTTMVAIQSIYHEVSKLSTTPTADVLLVLLLVS